MTNLDSILKQKHHFADKGWYLMQKKLEQTPGDSEGHGSLVCCSPWGSQRVGYNLATEQQQEHP